MSSQTSKVCVQQFGTARGTLPGPLESCYFSLFTLGPERGLRVYDLREPKSLSFLSSLYSGHVVSTYLRFRVKFEISFHVKCNRRVTAKSGACCVWQDNSKRSDFCRLLLWDASTFHKDATCAEENDTATITCYGGVGGRPRRPPWASVEARYDCHRLSIAPFRRARWHKAAI